LVLFAWDDIKVSAADTKPSTRHPGLMIYRATTWCFQETATLQSTMIWANMAARTTKTVMTVYQLVGTGYI